jgi:hypothetical protein
VKSIVSELKAVAAKEVSLAIVTATAPAETPSTV